MGKRPIDITVAGALLVITSPLLLAAAIAVRLMLGRPVLFRHVRPGLHGQPFTLYKLRTMRDDSDDAGRPLPDEVRITAFGRFLRSTSIDELPELFNVLKGDMSMVGPRPLLVEYLPYYTQREVRRHDVRPGITGWAQINGRNALTWQEKLDLDVYYVDNQSLWMDFRILARTVVSVVRREGIDERPCGNEATARPLDPIFARGRRRP